MTMVMVLSLLNHWQPITYPSYLVVLTINYRNFYQYGEFL